MNILFCSEGFIIDGVTAYNLYLSQALRRCGHNVAVSGRWAGFKSFYKRHHNLGVRLIRSLSITVADPRLVSRSAAFKPDILITDARRSFPLAIKIQKKTGARIITIFHDPYQDEQKRGRDIKTIIAKSDAWITPEKNIYDQLLKINSGLPVYWFQRPFTGVINPGPLPLKDPFRVLCLGRLSRWKTPGFKIIAENALELKKSIPSFEVTFLGGGRRRLNFLLAAAKANVMAGRIFVRVPGLRPDPQPWLEKASVVCAGAGSAVEAVLSRRPVLAFSGFWMGLITEDNLDYGIFSHFGEREGKFYVRDNPDAVCQSLIDIYNNWDDKIINKKVENLLERLNKNFNSDQLAANFQTVFDNHIKLDDPLKK